MDETYKVFVIMHRREEEMKSQKLLDNWERLKILKFFFLRTLLVLEIIAICANKVGISPVSRTYYTYFSCSSPLFSPFSLSSPHRRTPHSLLTSCFRSFVRSLHVRLVCISCAFLGLFFSISFPSFLFFSTASVRYIVRSYLTTTRNFTIIG